MCLGIFNREIQDSNKGRAKRASLITQAPLSFTMDNSRQVAPSPKKRIQPRPAPPWQGPVPSDFVVTPEVSRSPKEATKKQRELARTMKQDSVSGGSPSSDEVVDSPTIEFVNGQDTLDRIAHLYANCLIRNFVPNLLLELHFVLQLLVVRMKRTASQTSLLLGTVSNCAYFAVQVLWHGQSLLAMFEPSTLNLLKNLPHVKQMSEALHCKLSELCGQERSFFMFRSSFIQGVSFDATSDNADNFPTQQLFGAFRRQRDAFCELLKDWQAVTFGYYKNELRFTKRVRSIFDLSMDPCNLLHLAQLFVRQLVSTCCGSLETDESGNTSEKVLQDLRNRSPDKFSKLAGRLEKPVSTSLSTQYQFSGHQAFFHSFILEANYAQFHAHLKNVLIDYLLEGDKQDITPDDNETSIGSQIREELYTHLYRLRLYGAFLGLVEFLPYAMNCTVPPQTTEQQRKLRERMPPPIDLVESLRASIQEKRLLLTVSWTTAYLSMADQDIAIIATYQETWQILAALFRSCSSLDLYPTLLRLNIGWVFHNLSIPISFAGPTVDITLMPALEEFVDLQLLYMLCPFLSNLRSIIADYYCLNVSEVRKIAPVPIDEVSRPELLLETKLEEMFFFVHPPSLKKTVAFVAERIPANVVRSRKPELVLQFREEVTTALKQVRDSGRAVTAEIVRTLSQNLCARLQLRAENVLLPACDRQIGLLLDELIVIDCGPDGVLVAKRICVKQCHMRVLQWIRRHISKEYVHDLIRECNKADIDEGGFDETAFKRKPVDAHKASDSVGHVIDSLQDLVKQTMAGEMPAWQTTVENVRQALLNRREWTQSAWSAAEALLIDLGVVSIMRTASSAVAKAVVSIFEDVGLRGRYNVDSPRNRHMSKYFFNGYNDSIKILLNEYQLLIDGVNSTVNVDCNVSV
ncbi:codanin-1-like [Tropilaelaps mercedesae]|uniref:Codanin-1-like n=1 Tax=Tropilaelaps mercedesae TaxID=418985 RepID=A0A1V9XCW6_9ACAR|nr:codanin-1-like [Tropilaelaps mercedesae]